MRLEILYLASEILSKTAQSHGGSKYGNKDLEDPEVHRRYSYDTNNNNNKTMTKQQQPIPHQQHRQQPPP